MAIRLIVGLGNPGSGYATTRHNAGFRFVRFLAERFAIAFAESARVQVSNGTGHRWGGRSASVAAGHLHEPFRRGGRPLRPLLPDRARRSAGRPRRSRLCARHGALEAGGGANGHKGIESIIDGLGSREFVRLRIGVGHPGDKDRMLGYLTTATMPPAEWEQVEASCRLEDELIEALVRGDLQAAMNQLHKPQTTEN